MTKKLTKSWILTVIAFACTIIFPIANDSLIQYGVIITEQEMMYYLTVLLSVAGFGTASSIRKQLQEKKQAFKPLSDIITKLGIKIPSTTQITNNTTPSTLSIPPTLGPSTSWYKTNFRKDEKGNVIDYGESYLWVKLVGVRSYVTAKLMTDKQVPIQIDQSSEWDEDNDIETTRLELFTPDGKPLPRGKYILQTQGDRGTSDSMGIKNDEFFII